MTLDQAEQKAEIIFQEVSDSQNTIESEEDSKVRIINRIMSECLGWPINDFWSERKHDNGFSDYIIVNDDSDPCLLIEAKRIGRIKIKTTEKEKVRYLKISGSSLKETQEGIDQAASYAAPNGLPIAILTDGLSWIVFKPYISGANFKSKEAIVFPSPDSILNDFSVFYDLLSKNQFGKRIYTRVFDDIHNQRLLLSQKLIPPLDERDITLAQKSDLAFDLDKVFDNFFSRLTGDVDEKLLIDCFVETRESRIADFSLEKMTLNVLGNIVPKDRSVDSELTKLITMSVDENTYSSQDSGQNIFIVGPTGAGKTTFLERFFKKTLPLSVRNKCVVLNVNCLDATGSEDTALSWLTESLINSLENKIYDGNPNWDELRSLYHGDYVKRAKGIDAILYNSDKDKFRIKFGEYLENKTENDREGYLKRILSDAVDNRKILPIIVVDNSDEFSPKYKQDVFQFTQALRRHINHSLIIFPVTDKSAWSFSKTDIYGIYKSQSFFLPTPSPREVFRKRISYLESKLFEEGAKGSAGSGYFLGRGIRLSIDNLSGFAKVLENVFVEHDYVSKTLGELTNYNIRRTLILSQRIITSSVFEVEDLVKSYVSDSPITTSFTKFMDALMKGNYSAYKQSDNHELYPVFQVDSSIRQSPLVHLRILSLLESAHGNRLIEDRHMDIQSIVGYFDVLGCNEQSVERSLFSLLESGLIESYDSSNHEITNEQKLAISHKGKAHLRLASNNSVFFYQMALTTAIIDEDISNKILSIYKSDIKFSQKVFDIKKLFVDYLLREDSLYVVNSIETTHYDCQQDLLNNLRKFGIPRSDSDSDSDSDLVATFGNDFKQGVIKNAVLAIVDFYDESKGFGFTEIEGIEGRIFFHSEKLVEFGVDSVNDGDAILCDLARSKKGIFISKIHDIEENISASIVSCKIIRVFEERGYGFVKVDNSDKSAFFHITLFPKEARENITVGQELKVEIIPDKRSSGYQVKRVIS